VVSYAACLDELCKIAASKARMRVSKTRSGRRSMSVTTMLRKDKEGSLFKTSEDYGKNSKGFKLQGKTDVQGIPVAIENRKGSVRSGKNDDGTTWRTKYKVPYGYIEGTKGADGDEVDAYVGPAKDAPKAYVVHQKKEDGSYDEDTVMLGFRSKASAKKAILAHYDDPKYVGDIVTMGLRHLKDLMSRKKKLVKLSSRTTKKRKSDVPTMGGLASSADVETSQNNKSVATVM